MVVDAGVEDMVVVADAWVAAAVVVVVVAGSDEPCSMQVQWLAGQYGGSLLQLTSHHSSIPGASA